MPRPILTTPGKNKQDQKLKLNTSQGQRQQAAQMEQLVLDRMLRKPRSKEYMEALKQLDAGGHAMNQQKVQELIDVIKQEFPEVEIEGILLGYVSICYLGEPYEVHTLDMVGGIIEHYKVGQPLPNGMEKARSIALRGGYAFIEVYTNYLRAISPSGAVSVIPCE